MNPIVWKPEVDELKETNIAKFITIISEKYGVVIDDYWDLWRWSTECPEEFWSSLWRFSNIIPTFKNGQVLKNRDNLKLAEFFPNEKLNFAENLLKEPDDTLACSFFREDGYQQSISRKDLYTSVSRAQCLLKSYGAVKGDRVIGYLPNIPEAIIFMLATVSIGAIWSSCSPDFGIKGALDRIGQIQPKILVTVDGYYYGGKKFVIEDNLSSIISGIPSLEHIILVDYVKEPAVYSSLSNLSLKVHNYPKCAEKMKIVEMTFERFPFNTPAFILFTSGTTGQPKRIVHSSGGTLIKLLKEHILHFDVKKQDVFFYFTTTGWNMWYTLFSVLAAGASAVLYDGSPFYPKKDRFFDMVQMLGITHFGISPRYLQEIASQKVTPIKSHDLESVRLVISTGSPLSPQNFDYVYKNIKPKVRLSSISGGTEIMATLINGNPIGPVWRGELQAPTLGMKVEIFNEDGKSIENQKGELVCTKPFPSRPLYFWDDPKNERYYKTYFDRFDNVWCHGDFAEITKNRGFIIFGRSDATLNPGGIRIGTADIYRALDNLEVVKDSIATSLQVESDERVILFVKLSQGKQLSDSVRREIESVIRNSSSPRHVPAEIFQVRDIPYTINGKKLELVVKDIIHGRPPRNSSSVSDQDVLDEFNRLYRENWSEASRANST